eukprot:CAMPEP_0177376736 /NCGR_PEP_ID=MMETSP0368-20130122/45390_1 /TAXON_ID=447022 ORGANISM="Scrippsiella hangoei-like, Strain SHHI-4" /NCGR_SAMPLE_ID=MMETSP0368 /ASSEMBLY_ACC=CAM_ASM_000363 /LENGTH=169 /DNA_ID=CAMNT_0018840499 /DNA_START=61 /DNA_END=567 /DNA_ORIENTATION=-
MSRVLARSVVARTPAADQGGLGTAGPAEGGPAETELHVQLLLDLLGAQLVNALAAEAHQLIASRHAGDRGRAVGGDTNYSSVEVQLGADAPGGGGPEVNHQHRRQILEEASVGKAKDSIADKYTWPLYSRSASSAASAASEASSAEFLGRASAGSATASALGASSSPPA